MELFAARGFAPVTVEQICAAADVAKGTFFLHFSSKAALLTEWNRELAAELADRLREPRDSALAQYRMLADQLAEQWRRRPDATRALLIELLGSSAPADAEPDRDLRALVAQVVIRGQQRAEFRRNVSAPLAASMFLAACTAAFPDRDARGAGSDSARNELLHALLHGLSEPKPRLKWTATP